MATPKILAFDVFGTVVDWHGSIRREAEAMMGGLANLEPRLRVARMNEIITKVTLSELADLF